MDTLQPLTDQASISLIFLISSSSGVIYAADDHFLLTVAPLKEHAVSGLQLIVKDGKVNDWSPLEPFAYVRHPRTVAGVTKDGRIILLEVDGRIPEYSNGATLLDLANMMIKLGADRAVNLDGGGSSVVYIKKGDRFELQSNPADLIRPTAKLIRREYNCLLVVKF